MQYTEILEKLKSLSDPVAIAGMARFGIDPENTYGISIPKAQKIAKQIGKDRMLAEQLLSLAIHEARILACMIDDLKVVTQEQLERWVM
jgi:3-methyladenine DNA glycosylase AlkD